MNDVFAFWLPSEFCFRGFTATAHRINKPSFFLSTKFLYAYEIWLLEIYKFLIQHRKTEKNEAEEKRQIKRKSTRNRLNIRIQINDIYILLIKIESFPACAFLLKCLCLSLKCINSRTRQAECYYEMHYQK
jgi:hypothetical protein